MKSENTRRRVVVTGIGLVSPVGIGIEENWSSLISGKSGIGPITRFDCSAFATKIAGEVKNFHPEEFISKKELRKMDPFLRLALGAAHYAMEDAGLRLLPRSPPGSEWWSVAALAACLQSRNRTSSL